MNLKDFKVKDVIVSHPSIETDKHSVSYGNELKKILFYPAFPRLFKNFETICEAAKLVADNTSGF